MVNYSKFDIILTRPSLRFNQNVLAVQQIGNGSLLNIRHIINV